MPMPKPDLLERLVDFDRHGLNATERFNMRMDAYHEIMNLRAEVAALKGQVGAFSGSTHRPRVAANPIATSRFLSDGR